MPRQLIVAGALHFIAFVTTHLSRGVWAYQDDHLSPEALRRRTAGGSRVWPFPSPSYDHPKSTDAASVLRIDACTFTIYLDNHTSAEFKTGIQMYADIMFPPATKKDCPSPSRKSADTDDLDLLQTLIVKLDGNAEHVAPHYLRISPNATLIERYYLTVTASPPSATLTISHYLGLLRGLETFAQLLIHPPHDEQSKPTDRAPVIKIMAPIRIEDQPDFTYRGILLDVSRNFYPVEALKRCVDALMYSKMNVMHLHLSDTQSFPLQLTRGHGPNITFHGAYSKHKVYSVSNIADLIRYGQQRGVTIIPEIDTPGHSRAIGLSPELRHIISCGDAPAGSRFCAEAVCGQLNITNELVFTVLQDVLKDVADMFATGAGIVSPYIHLGFDEINSLCWTEGDPSFNHILQQRGITEAELITQFFNREREMIPSGINTMYWNEVVNRNLQRNMKPGDIVQFWRSGVGIAEYLNASSKTNGAIVSSDASYYLDCGTGNEYGKDRCAYNTWRKIYFIDFLSGRCAEWRFDTVLNRDRVRGIRTQSSGPVHRPSEVGCGTTNMGLLPVDM